MGIPRWMRELHWRAGQSWEKLLRYIICFGAIRGSFLFLIGIAWPRANGRLISVVVPGFPHRVFVRLGTTDVVVFNDIYRGGEYDWNFSVPPKTIVDAGAYTGLSTVFFATRYPEAKIIAIEPDRKNFELLALNTTKMPNVHTIRAALWAESGTVSLRDPGDGAWSFRLAESDQFIRGNGSEGTDRATMSVTAVTLTDVMRDHGLEKIDLLKLDIEGCEKEIFENSDPWIENVQAICLELHDRFKAGCSRAFYKAVDDFPIELRRGEDVLVTRDEFSSVN
jgi:FkbM family methyltransferase